MTDRELRKLRRSDLLELLIQQDEEMEALKDKLADAERRLKLRKIAIDTAGSIAAASVSISGVFEAAQDAAARYLENVEEMSVRQEEECARMAEQSRREAEALLKETKERCRKMEEEARRHCEEMKGRGKTERETKAQTENYWAKPEKEPLAALADFAYSS